MTDQTDDCAKRDLARRLAGFMIAWGAPLFILLALGVFDFLPAAVEISVVAGAFAWMGIGCVVNAARCGRLHCFFSGPILLAGAALILLIGFDLIRLGPLTTSQISYGAGLLALSTCVLELFWGAYVKNSPGSGGAA